MFRKKQKPTPSLRQSSTERSTPAPVFSYHSSRSVSARNTGRNETIEVPGRRYHRPNLKYLPTWLSLFAIVISGLYALTLTADAKVVVANPDGALNRSEEVYHQAMGDILSSSFTSYTKLTVDTDGAVRKLQQRYPEVQHASVTIPLLGRRPVVVIQTAEPAFLLTSTASGAYFIDSGGRATLKPDVLEKSEVRHAIVRDESGILVEPNKQILSKDNVEFITTIIQQLADKNIAIEYLELPKTPFELRLKPAGKDYYVKFNTEEEGRLQAGTYLAVKQKLEADGAVPKEYIDVRVPERAYYK